MGTCIFVSLQSHIIAELSELEGTQKDHWVQLLSEFGVFLGGVKTGRKLTFEYINIIAGVC